MARLSGKRPTVPCDSNKLEVILRAHGIDNTRRLSEEMGYNGSYVGQYLRDLQAIPLTIATYLEKMYSIAPETYAPDKTPEPVTQSVAPQVDMTEVVEAIKALTAIKLGLMPDDLEKQLYRMVLNAVYFGVKKAIKDMKGDGLL